MQYDINFRLKTETVPLIWSGQRTYDVIIMDINLCEGLTVLKRRQIRPAWTPTKEVPIIASNGKPVYTDPKDNCLRPEWMPFCPNPFLKDDSSIRLTWYWSEEARPSDFWEQAGFPE